MSRAARKFQAGTQIGTNKPKEKRKSAVPAAALAVTLTA